MISVYNIKPKFQQLLSPILAYLYRWGVTANAITLTAITLSLGAGLAFWYWPAAGMFLVIPGVLLLRMALNALDGMMARRYSMQSKLGEVLNELGDVVSDVCLFFPFVRLDFIHPYGLFSFILLSVINEFAGLLGKVVGGERRYEGPMGKSDRALLWGLICLLLYFWPGFKVWVNPVLIVAILLLLLSTFTRIRKTLL